MNGLDSQGTLIGHSTIPQWTNAGLWGIMSNGSLEN